MEEAIWNSIENKWGRGIEHVVRYSQHLEGIEKQLVELYFESEPKVKEAIRKASGYEIDAKNKKALSALQTFWNNISAHCGIQFTEEEMKLLYRDSFAPLDFVLKLKKRCQAIGIRFPSFDLLRMIKKVYG
jgi:hypothetical protein